MKTKIVMLGISLAPLNAWAVSAEETSSAEQPISVTATGETGGSLTVPSNDVAREIINQTPGGVSLVEGSDIENRLYMSYEDSLAMVPGVSAKKRYGEEVRLSIRGSGLSRGYHMRGIKLTQDGIPFNLADGGGDFQELDPFITQRIEVFKGGNALQYGGTTLGGAVNTVSKTGRSNPGFEINLLGGSYDTYRGNLQAGHATDKYDVFGSLSGTTSHEFREHDDMETLRFSGNAGIRLTDRLETRFYFTGNHVDQQLPGSVSRYDALHDPKPADPSAVATDWGRDIRSLRFANKTTLQFNDDELLDVGVFYNHKDLWHPITPFAGILDHQSQDYGAFANVSGNTDIAGHANRYRIGVIGQFGKNDADVYANVGGQPGAQTSDTLQEASDLVIYGENAFYAMPELALITGAQLTRAERKLTDYLNPAASDSKTYNSVNPKLGVMYEPNDNLQFFANVSYSNEAPTFIELTQSGLSGFTPVESQKAWTAEIGSRGTHGRFGWDVALYRAWLKDEMLQYTTGPGIPASTFNADRTVHQGLELGFDVLLASDLFGGGGSLTWRNSYTWSDFFFDDDAQYGDNDIPGIAAHFYQAELRYDHNDVWYVAPGIEASSSAYVDFMNTVKAPGYLLLNLSAGYNVNENVTLYLDARNLLDTNYITTFSTIISNTGNTNVYYPGEGRRAFVGLRAKF